MPDLPTATLTFLFTDVEGSTRLREAHPAAMRQGVARHDALLTAAFAEHDGVVVRPRGEGDSLFTVFVRATEAVAGALAGQRALLAEDWGVVGPLRVRMARHTGETDLRAGDHYDSAVNRRAPVRGVAQDLGRHAVRRPQPHAHGVVDFGPTPGIPRAGSCTTPSRRSPQPRSGPSLNRYPKRPVFTRSQPYRYYATVCPTATTGARGG